MGWMGTKWEPDAELTICGLDYQLAKLCSVLKCTAGFHHLFDASSLTQTSA